MYFILGSKYIHCIEKHLLPQGQGVRSCASVHLGNYYFYYLYCKQYKYFTGPRQWIYRRCRRNISVINNWWESEHWNFEEKLRKKVLQPTRLKAHEILGALTFIDGSYFGLVDVRNDRRYFNCIALIFCLYLVRIWVVSNYLSSFVLFFTFFYI